jgi:predicted RNase H-like nuclease (RuvC/YqgF family)
MSAKWRTTGIVLMAVVGTAGFQFLTAQERSIKVVRATPKQLKEHIESHPVLTAASGPSIGQCIQELNDLAIDLDQAGQRTESKRLKNSVNEIVRRLEQQLMEKKAQVGKLNDEIEELKRAVAE